MECRVRNDALTTVLMLLTQVNRSVDRAAEAGVNGVDFFLGPSEPVTHLSFSLTLFILTEYKIKDVVQHALR